MFELVIFDCDGVLVDSEPITCRVLATALSEIGLPSAPEDCHEYIGTWWPDAVAMIEAKLGGPLPSGFTESFRSRQRAELARSVEPVDGVVEVLDRIEARTCVGSNGPREKMEVTLGRCGLLERFEGRIFSAYDDGVEAGKPAPDLFLHAARSLAVEPAACAVIEDSALGISAARAAGMAAFGFSANGETTALREAGATVVAEIGELPRILGSQR